MLKKLMKYDLIWINKFMLIYFAITLILSLLTRGMSYFNNSFVGNLIYQILKGCTISAFVSCLINMAIRTWVRFRNNIYKDESYLTHTLPVSKSTLYNSKILSIIISILITLCVLVICFIIAFLNESLLKIIKEIFTSSDTTFMLISLVITVILETIYMIYSGILGILLGHKSNNGKTIKSVFIGIALYFSIQIIILIIVYLLGLAFDDLNMLFTTDLIIIPAGKVESSLKFLVVLVNLIYVIFTSIMYFIGKNILNQGIDVE